MKFPDVTFSNVFDGMWIFSWLLLMLLDSLHYTHASEHCSQNLHLLFAEQLESVGQWHWAIFVLLHIVDPTM
jgi:nuclear pore complex protein Nup98-Nup96